MDYLTKKWKMWFKSLDVDHDGKISLQDVEESRNKFTDLHHLLGDKAETVRTDVESWWTTYILKGEHQLTEGQFLSNLTTIYKQDKVDFKAHIQRCFEMIFDVIDTNKDCSIELKEFIFAFKAFGHENEDLVTKTFKRFDKELVPLREMVAAWVQFVTDDDSSNRDIIYEVFQAGV
ncbi:sarcoplasmic calcium-binding protein-like [Saccostrea cucullata]|uniref:sarcoplasmic calcium-binding protein-like n=1 Tax=Saccostrea cuccullata TaxID=36930 RepID=UPI002ED42C0C